MHTIHVFDEDIIIKTVNLLLFNFVSDSYTLQRD